MMILIKQPVFAEALQSTAILFSIYSIKNMGNKFQKNVNICCQPREHILEGDIQAIELTKPKPLIDSDAFEASDLSSNSATLQSKQNHPKNDAVTASTNFTDINCKTSGSNFRNIVNIKDVTIRIDENLKKQLKIPFSIVRMTLSKRLIENIEIYSSRYLQKFEGQSERFYEWNLTQKGHYICFFSEKIICAFSETTYYQGQYYITATKQYIPESQGLLINQEGIYKGSFINGKANGKGKFIQANCLLNYKGEWLDGEFIEGVIQNQIIKFTGLMDNGLAAGDGKLFWKKQEMSFSGNFKKGLFEGSNCILITPNYKYEGGFRAGKKAGKGSIIQKQQKIDIKIGSTRVKKYRPSFTILGLWQNDDLIEVNSQY